VIKMTLLAAVAFAALSSANASETAADFDRASFMRESSKLGFDAAEEERLTQAADGEASSIIDLGRFYMAHELWIEALAAFDRLEENDAADALSLKAECAYRMGRYANVVDMLANSVRAEPLKAMALSRLGAYMDAAALFSKTGVAETPQNLRRDFRLAAAEAYAKSGDPLSANAILEGAAFSSADLTSDTRLDFAVSLIRKAEGQSARAAAALRRAAASDIDEWSMRARLAIAAEASDAQEIEILALQYRGGAFDREKRQALGEIRLAGGDFDRGFSALSGLVDRFPRSDDAMKAQDSIASNLPKLFAFDATLHPKDAARLFFENVEFAPPGAEGDALIRNASDRLVALGLYRQAADLLDHQTFKRLRGAERARVAADLAETLLAAGDPKKALRVIRSTRMAGLDEDLNQKRKRLEARALAATGDVDAALASLNDAPEASDILLRAEINWTRKAWGDAARDYAAYAAKLASFDKAGDRAAAVRGATAFLLAGDRDGYRTFAREISKRLNGAPEATLIETLGDADQRHFLANVMNSYRAVYSGDDS